MIHKPSIGNHGCTRSNRKNCVRLDPSSRKTSEFELARVEFKNAINYASRKHKSTIPRSAHVTILQALSTVDEVRVCAKKWSKDMVEFERFTVILDSQVVTGDLALCFDLFLARTSFGFSRHLKLLSGGNLSFCFQIPWLVFDTCKDCEAMSLFKN